MSRATLVTLGVAAVIVLTGVAGLRQTASGAKSVQAVIKASALHMDQISNIPVGMSVPICATSDVPTIDVNHLVWSHRLKASKLKLVTGQPNCRFYTAPNHPGHDQVSARTRNGKLRASTGGFAVIPQPPRP